MGNIKRSLVDGTVDYFFGFDNVVGSGLGVPEKVNIDAESLQGGYVVGESDLQKQLVLSGATLTPQTITMPLAGNFARGTRIMFTATNTAGVLEITISTTGADTFEGSIPADASGDLVNFQGESQIQFNSISNQDGAVLMLESDGTSAWYIFGGQGNFEVVV